ncbi:porin family protein [Xanthomonas campestris pv. phormiicola]|nr:porin family protein [Xanthomonas campestris pv. phormiicola]UYC16353.1 porin family protein [Xanthomonas campestris pv. phormiicola]
MQLNPVQAFAAVFVFAVSGTSACAQSVDRDWYAGLTASYTVNDSHRTENNGWAVGAVVGKVLDDHWNVELSGQYADFGAKDDQANIVADALYFLARAHAFSPYVTLGVGDVYEGGLPAHSAFNNLLLRGGVGFTTAVAANVDLRVDTRYQWHDNVAGTPPYGDWFVSIGANYHFQ